MRDYLLVGAGLAGLAFAEAALRNGRRVTIIDNLSQHSSSVAAGLVNPVSLKRLKAIPGASGLLDMMNAFYNRVPMGQSFKHSLPILRKFHSVEEQNQWFEAADSPMLSPWLNPQLHREQYKGISAPFGFGEVNHTGYVDTKSFISHYRKHLRDRGVFIDGCFDYRSLDGSQTIWLNGEEYAHVIFAEGFGLHQNPYFNYLPLNGTKGEILLIKADGLKLDKIVNAGIFILPLGDGIFKIGATYEHLDKTNVPTQQGRAQLQEKLSQLIDCPFVVTGHHAGIRPTVRDRQPLLGRHPTRPNLAVLNGLGTRGVLFAPSLAAELLRHLEEGTPLQSQNDIARFRKFFTSGNE